LAVDGIGKDLKGTALEVGLGFVRGRVGFKSQQWGWRGCFSKGIGKDSNGEMLEVGSELVGVRGSAAVGQQLSVCNQTYAISWSLPRYCSGFNFSCL
jgi:hypothetical protein